MAAASSVVSGSFQTFTGSKDDPNLSAQWTEWLERFENDLVAWAIDDDTRKKALLLRYGGDLAWEKWSTVPADERGAANAYETAKTLLNNHFQSTRNVDSEIRKFRMACQRPNESIDNYVTRLRGLAKYCNFGDRLNNELKLQIKLSCTSTQLRRRAFAEENWGLDDVLKHGRALEMSEKQSREIESGLASDINRLRIRRETKPQSQSQSYSKKEECGHCGFEYPHEGGAQRCPAARTQCKICQRIGHFARKCRSKHYTTQGRQVSTRSRGRGSRARGTRNTRGRRPVNMVSDRNSTYEDAQPTQDESEVDFVYNLTDTENTKQIPRYTVTMAGSPVTVVADTGATCDIIDKGTFDHLNETYELNHDMSIKLTPADLEIMSYNSTSPVPLLGKFKTMVAYGAENKSVVATVYVAGGKSGNLLSYNTCLALGLIQVINHTIPLSGETVTDAVIMRYPELFTGIGKLKGKEIKLHIDETVKPVAQPHRRIPFHLRKKVEKEIKLLEDQDIIEKVDGPTPWISPIVAPRPVRFDVVGIRLKGGLDKHQEPAIELLQNAFEFV